MSETPNSKILVSACLLGNKVRYDGNDCLIAHEELFAWQQAGRVVVICPEVAGGLPAPRARSMIHGEGSGMAVLEGKARIIDEFGKDVTAIYLAGAQKTLELAQANNINVAILKERSPSCGRNAVYAEDGETRIAGMGSTAALLEKYGIRVFSEDQIDDALKLVMEVDSDK